MRNLICLCLTVMGFTGISNGQTQQKRYNTLTGGNKDQVVNLIQFLDSGRVILPDIVKQTNLFKTKLIKSDWDTIVAYNGEELGQRLTQSFNGQGCVLIRLQQLRQANKWVNSQRYTYTYDTNGNMLTYIPEEWVSGSWQPAKGGLIIYSSGSAVYFVIGFRYTSTFTSFNTGIPDINPDINSAMSVFPNPAKGIITVEYPAFIENNGEMIAIYTVQGQLILNQQLVRVRSEITLTGLPKGIYIIKLIGGKKAQVSSFVIE